MANLMTVTTLGPQLIKLLGLPKHVISFELRCAVDEIVTVRCEYHPEEADGFDTALAEYELVPRTTGGQTPAECPQVQIGADGLVRLTHPAQVMGFDAWMRERTEAAHAAMMAHGTKDQPCLERAMT